MQILDSTHFYDLCSLLKNIEQNQFNKTEGMSFVFDFLSNMRNVIARLKIEIQKPEHITLSTIVTYIEQNYHNRFTVKYAFRLQKNPSLKAVK